MAQRHILIVCASAVQTLELALDRISRPKSLGLADTMRLSTVAALECSVKQGTDPSCEAATSLGSTPLLPPLITLRRVV